MPLILTKELREQVIYHLMNNLPFCFKLERCMIAAKKEQEKIEFDETGNLVKETAAV